MQLALTQDDRILQESLRRFSRETLSLPLASDKTEAQNLEPLFPTLADMGLWTLNLPLSRGGSDMSLRAACLTIEEISRQHPSLGTVLALRLGLINPTFSHLEPTFELKPGRPGAAILLQTPHDNILLLGEEEPTLVATQAGYGFITRSEGFSAHGSSLLGLRGLTRSAFTPAAEYPAPSERIAVSRLTTPLAICLASVALGIAHRATREALQYAGERSQFGKTLDRFQAIQFKLADMATQLDTSRWLLYRASTADRPDLALASFDHAIEAALFCTDEALQIHGGYGYTTDYPVEVLYRDALAISNLGQQLLMSHR